MKFIYVKSEGRDHYINVDHITSFAARLDSLNRHIGSVINIKDGRTLWVEDELQEILSKIDVAPNRGE